MHHLKWSVASLCFVIMLYIAYWLSGGQSLPIASAAPLHEESSPDVQTATPQLSTPELIEQAFVKGEVTKEQRLLYLAYALYEYQSLPERFRSTEGWFGTAYIEEVQAATNLVTAAAFSATTQAELTRVTTAVAATTVCDRPDGTNNLQSINFRLNYTGTIGGGLTAQKYLDSLEKTFATEVTNYGWAKPPVCTAGTGTCTATNPWSRYPVQAANLGGGLYGYVTPAGGSYTGNVGNNSNTATTETMAQATCMVLNSNFSQIPGHTAQENLDVTTAHEFNHSIQRGYSGGTEDRMWRESGASYIEDEVFDSINDNYQYLWPVVTNCLGEWPNDSDPGRNSQYSNWLFFRYAAEHNGSTNKASGGEDIMQAFWVNRGASQGSLAAYNNALGTKGKNLADTFHNYAIASRFTKSCPADSPYCFEEAADYVRAKGAVKSHTQINNIGGVYTGNLQNNYAINWVDLPTNGIYSISLENQSAGGKFKVSIVADTGTQLQVTAFPEVVMGNKRVSLPKYEPPKGAKSVVVVITNQDQTADDPVACTSNPYRLGVAPPVAFVIDDTGSMGDEINAVKVTVNQKIDEFAGKGLFPNYHLITYKDNVTYRGNTPEPATIKGWVNGLFASGGGDCPEEMLGALNRLAAEAPQSEAWLMTDAGFHGGLGDVATTIFNLLKAKVKVHFIVYSWCFDSVAAASASVQGDETQSYDQVTAAAASVGPQSFAQIANETGGHYFQIASSQTQAATSILLNEMITNADLTKQTGSVSSGSPKIYNISIDSTTKEANFLLTGFSGNVTLLLKRPNGATVNPSDPDITYTSISNIQYYQTKSPAVGIWQAQVTGNGEFAFSSSGSSEISFAYLSDTSLVKDKSVNLLASLLGSIASVEFQLVRADGSLLEKVALFDDGAHGDNAANDGTYGGSYTPKVAGSFRFVARGTTKDGTAFERIATEIIRVQTLSVVGENKTAPAGGSVVHDFAITNGGPAADIFELTVSSSKGWADLSGVPPTVNIPAGQTVHVTIPVNVPAGTSDGTTNEIIFATVSQTDPLVNDTASVFTTVSSAPACVQFTLRLTGAQEAPPTPSKVIGTGVVRVETATNTLSYQIMVKKLPTAETGAHLHGFAPAGSNAGVLYQLPLGAFKTGKLTYTEAQEANILAGQTYVNVHTRQYPNGEIRGQIANGVACPTTVLAAEADALEATVGAIEEESTDEGTVDETVEMMYHLYLPVIHSDDTTVSE